MPPQLALLITITLSAWFFVKDRKLRPMSRPLWVVLFWVAIVGSKPISVWWGVQPKTYMSPEDYLSGSPVDRNFYLILIIGTFIALARRHIKWRDVITENRWLVFLFGYWLVSLLWSEYTFIGFKRWSKDFGLAACILVIATEPDPKAAFKAVFARCAYFALPFSLLFMKYYGNLGVAYDRDGNSQFVGITTHKNELGCISFISSLFLMWELIELLRKKDRERSEVAGRVLLLLMGIVLLIKAGSSTSWTALFIGATCVLLMQLANMRRQVEHLGAYAFIGALLLLIPYLIPGVIGPLVRLLGRDLKFTGRTDVWAELLGMRINPIVGTGYQSFWLGPWVKDLWVKFPFRPNQAHNGYIETYLNGGLIAICLLIGIIISSGAKLKNHLIRGDGFAVIRFAFLVAIVFYNWTEGIYDRLSPAWIMFLFGAISYSSQFKVAALRVADAVSAESSRRWPMAIQPSARMNNRFQNTVGIPRSQQ